MSDKLVWSDDMTMDGLLALSEDDLRAELEDIDYLDSEFIDTMSYEDLVDFISNDDTLWQIDFSFFEREVEPMINTQTANGIVLMIGEVGRWDGNRSGGKAVFTEQLSGGDIDPDVEHVEIIDRDGGLVWLGHHHDGTHKMGLYAIPEDNIYSFINTCMQDALADEYEYHYTGEAETLEDALEDDLYEYVLANITDLPYLNDYIDFKAAQEFCEPIRNTLNIAVAEDLNEANTKDPKGLKKELKEIKKLADDYGYEYFTSMPFSNYDNDPISIEYNYPEFARIVKLFFKEMEIASKEELENTDYMDELWDTNISQHDWDVIITTCEKLVAKPGSYVQIEKEYKTGYNSPIDDEQVLAAREYVEEDLHEAWDSAVDYANYSWSHPEVDIEKMLIKDGKDKKFINAVYDLLDEFATEEDNDGFMDENLNEAKPVAKTYPWEQMGKGWTKTGFLKDINQLDMNEVEKACKKRERWYALLVHVNNKGKILYSVDTSACDSKEEVKRTYGRIAVGAVKSTFEFEPF